MDVLVFVWPIQLEGVRMVTLRISHRILASNLERPTMYGWPMVLVSFLQLPPLAGLEVSKRRREKGCRFVLSWLVFRSVIRKGRGDGEADLMEIHVQDPNIYLGSVSPS